jgi:GntR family transcriptional regulator
VIAFGYQEDDLATSKDLSRVFKNAVDRNSPIPYYVQVKQALQEYIEHSYRQPGDQLPGEPELCRLFDVSRTVIRQALREMQYEGMIVKRKGKGTFVAEPKIVEHLFQNLTGFYQDMVERGFTPVTKILKQELVPASPKVAGYLGLDPGVSVIQIYRLRSVEDVPIILDNTYLPYALCPKVLDTDLTSRSLYAFLEQEYGFVIARGRRTLEAVAANEYEASLLEVDAGSPLLLLDSVSYLDNGVPIEYFHGLHRGDRSKFEVELVRIRHMGGIREILGKDSVQLPQGSVVVDVDNT